MATASVTISSPFNRVPWGWRTFLLQGPVVISSPSIYTNKFFIVLPDRLLLPACRFLLKPSKSCLWFYSSLHFAKIFTNPVLFYTIMALGPISSTPYYHISDSPTASCLNASAASRWSTSFHPLSSPDHPLSLPKVPMFNYGTEPVKDSLSLTLSFKIKFKLPTLGL